MSSRWSKADTAGDPPARTLPERVAVGRVRRPHGVRGELRVEVLSDNEQRFEPGSQLWLSTEGQASRQVRVIGRRFDKADVLLTLEGFDQRDQVEPLRGALFEVPREQVPAAEDGTYYYFELEGCRCRDRTLGDLGTVVDLLEDGGGLLLVVRNGESEVPIPFVARFLQRVDVERGEIDLDLPPGLVDICTSRS